MKNIIKYESQEKYPPHTQPTGRLDFIDLAKGIGMFMVIYLHITINYPAKENIYGGSHWDGFVHSMFMPLFFVLSGLFFSTKLSFKEWIVKKANRMLVPFVMFYLLTYLINVILVTFFHVEFKSGFSYEDIFVVFHKDVFPNSAIWFLLALFWSSIIMYWILRLSAKFVIQSALVFLSFAVGYVLDCQHINIPLYVDTAFSAVPFLYAGYLAKKGHVFRRLDECKGAARMVIVAAVGLVCFVFDWNWGQGGSMVNNQGVSFLFLLSGFTGSVACICVAYILKRIPLVSYVGKYSMLVLCTHMFLTNAYSKILLKFDIPFVVSSILALMLVAVSYYAVVPIVKSIKPLKCIL